MSAAAYSGQDAARIIREMESEFERHANAHDAHAMVEGYFAEDAQLLPPNAPAVKGKSAIREYWTAFLAAGCSQPKMETLDVTESGDLAYSVGQYGYTLDGARHTGKYLVIYRRQGGGYRAVADAFSDNA